MSAGITFKKVSDQSNIILKAAGYKHGATPTVVHAVFKSLGMVTDDLEPKPTNQPALPMEEKQEVSA